MSASVIFKVGIASTSNTNSYTTGSFTPTAGDLIVVFVHSSGTLAPSGTGSDSQGNSYTLVASAQSRSGGDINQIYVANALAAATSTTFTFSCPSDSATGADIDVYTVSGVTRTGTLAVKQTAILENQSTGTPSISLGSAVLTSNPVLSSIGNQTKPAAVTQASGWTSGNSSGYSTPTTGQSTAYINSGFTSSTVTWGGTSHSAYGATVIEIDSSTLNQAPSAPTLLTPSNGASVSSTPSVTFTSTDPDGDDITYEIQIDTLSTFNSQ